MSNLARGGMRTAALRNPEDHSHHATTSHTVPSSLPRSRATHVGGAAHPVDLPSAARGAHPMTKDSPGGGKHGGNPPHGTNKGGGKGGNGGNKWEKRYKQERKELRQDRKEITKLRKGQHGGGGGGGNGWQTWLPLLFGGGLGGGDTGGGLGGGTTVVPGPDSGIGGSASAPAASGPPLTIVLGGMTIVGFILYLVYQWYEKKHGKKPPQMGGRRGPEVDRRT